MCTRLLLILVIGVHADFLLAQDSRSSKQTLVIATYQYAENTRVKNIQPFADHFSEVMAAPTVVKSYATPHQLVEAMKAGEVDIAFMNTFGYLILQYQTTSYEISAALHLPEANASLYKSIIVTPRENQLHSLEEGVHNAADNLLILVSVGSTSGNLIPRLKLASMMEGDPEFFFLEVQYAGTHQLALQNVLNEKYAMGAFGSEEYYKLGADTVKLTKLWESPSIPLGPVACKKTLSENIKSTLQQTLLNLHQENQAALESIKAAWTEAIPADRFILIQDSYYDSLMDLAGSRDRARKIVSKFAR
jgi:phosphate/phosphite/phosphonate ABC transporter binding protein